MGLLGILYLVFLLVEKGVMNFCLVFCIDLKLGVVCMVMLSIEVLGFIRLMDYKFI